MDKNNRIVERVQFLNKPTVKLLRTAAYARVSNGKDAVLYSIAATAQANGIDTEQYLTELFSQPVGTISLPFNT